MKDIYFDENYGKLYEKVEHGEAVVFKCETQNGTIINQFIKREIPLKLDGNTYFDIVTPYGYGGPYIENVINKEDLLKDYEKEFTKYCLDNNIVAEFVRFHPLFDNAKDVDSIYHPFYNRHTLGTNLKDFDDPIREEFSKSCRKHIRSKLNMGMSFRVTNNPTNFDTFKKCYYSTMERNEATDYYYFDDDYFNKIHEFYGPNTILVETIYNDETIAAGLYYICNKIIHIHLSGTLKEYLHLSPAYILRYGVATWGKENGYEMIHHGGGRSSSEEDNLYLFKEQFAKKTKFDFYLGKKVWNQEIYDRLCIEAGVLNDEEYFPAYRKVLT